jgi:hypothetical protein
MYLTEQDERAVFTLMSRIGGSFAKALAEAWKRADLDNQRRIRNAFPELVRDYLEMVRAGHGVEQ